MENLQQAWFEIKSKPGNLISEGDQEGEILDGLELDWFKEVSDKLKSGNYVYKPARSILINKFIKGGKRPLTIDSLRDKVVQKAILRVMSQIYEGVSIWEQVDYDTFKKFKNPDCPLYGVDFKRSRREKGSKIYEIRK